MIHKELDNKAGKNDFTRSINSYYHDLRPYNPLPKEVERELIIKAKNGDNEARNQLLTSNLKFVFDIAKKYRGHGVDIGDLISEGNDGMIYAIEKFDIKQDIKFFSYAVWWIRQRMLLAIQRTQESNINETSISEVFGGNDFREENIPSDNNEDENLDDFNVVYEENNVMELSEEEKEKKRIVNKMLSSLNDRERCIICKYFGIETPNKPQNLEEIGSELKLTTERVRQIKVKAINRMRTEVFNIEEASFLF